MTSNRYVSLSRRVEIKIHSSFFTHVFAPSRSLLRRIRLLRIRLFPLGRSRLLVACRYLGASCTAVRLVASRRREVDIQHKTARKILSSLSKWLPIKQPEFTAREIVFIIRQCQRATRALYALPPSYLRCVCLSAEKNGSRRCELLKPRKGGEKKE